MNLSSCNEKQIEAIQSRDCSILVSAPAGSGKTKILVTRILSLLLEGANVNQLVVLTFTKAAANEMKQRLGEDLRKEIMATTSPKQRAHLEKQLELLPQAYITNFHSFCQEILKQYGYIINLDANFEILADTAVLKEAAFDQAFEKWAATLQFGQFVQRRYPGYSFRKIKATIETIERMANTIYDFDSFIEHALPKMTGEFVSYEPSPISDTIKMFLMEAARNGLTRTELVGEYCQSVGMGFYFDKEDKKETETSPYHAYSTYYSTIIEYLKSHDLADIVKQKFEIAKKYTIPWKKAGIDDSIKTEYNRLTKDIHKEYDNVFNTIITPDATDREMIGQSVLTDLQYLATLALEYRQVYRDLKSQRNYLDFNDLEQYAIKLLQPELQVAQKIHGSLKEIMIDEYQDTNPIQESIIDLIGDVNQPVINRFMVGDMKQSIYRFRDADPKIFKEKYDSYATSANDNLRIELNYNYRSHKTVLDSINFIFNQIMDESIGGLEYYEDPNAQLNYDLKPDLFKIQDPSSAQSLKDHATEVLLVDKSPGDYEADEYEAISVALRIKELVQEGYQLEDINILMRSTTQLMTFKNIFDRMDIANEIILKSGFYQAGEVNNLINVIRTLVYVDDNIAMASLLLGNYKISNFDEGILQKLASDGSIYQNMAEAITNETPGFEEFRPFFEYLGELQAYHLSHHLDETLAKFIEDSGFLSFNSALRNGAQRVANINLLVEILKDYRGLSAFEVLNTLETMMATGQDRAPGLLATTDSNAVKFMTIHASKGLEAKIIFVSTCHKQFNIQDTREEIIFNNSLGMTTYPILKMENDDNLTGSVRFDNSWYQLIGANIKKESVDEEMRIFYVALTRAKEKLILTGQIKDSETMLKWAQKAIHNDYFNNGDHVIINRYLGFANNYLDWTMPAIMRHPSILNQLKTGAITIGEAGDYENELKMMLQKIMIYNGNNIKLHGQSNTNASDFKIHFYPHEYLELKTSQYNFKTVTPEYITLDRSDLKPFNQTLKEKSIAVTRLIDHQDDKYVSYDFASDEEKVSASSRGTIIHRVIELLDKNPSSDIDFQLERIKVEEFGQDLEAIELIDKYRPVLVQFGQSELFDLICSFERLYQEKSIAVKQDGQIIHAVLDCLGFVDDKIYIIDYKTDRVRQNAPESELIGLHREQLEYYRQFMAGQFPNHQIINCIHYLQINRTVQF